MWTALLPAVGTAPTGGRRAGILGRQTFEDFGKPLDPLDLATEARAVGRRVDFLVDAAVVALAQAQKLDLDATYEAVCMGVSHSSAMPLAMQVLHGCQGEGPSARVVIHCRWKTSAPAWVASIATDST